MSTDVIMFVYWHPEMSDLLTRRPCWLVVSNLFISSVSPQLLVGVVNPETQTQAGLTHSLPVSLQSFTRTSPASPVLTRTRN